MLLRLILHKLFTQLAVYDTRLKEQILSFILNVTHFCFLEKPTAIRMLCTNQLRIDFMHAWSSSLIIRFDSCNRKIDTFDVGRHWDTSDSISTENYCHFVTSTSEFLLLNLLFYANHNECTKSLLNAKSLRWEKLFIGHIDFFLIFLSLRCFCLFIMFSGCKEK